MFTTGGTNDPGLYAASGQSARVTVGGVPQAYGIMDFGHQGLLHDTATGLVYNRAWYLSTELDRFMQQDPMGYVDGANQYQGFQSNPLSWGNPSGKVVIFVHGIGKSLSQQYTSNGCKTWLTVQVRSSRASQRVCKE